MMKRALGRGLGALLPPPVESGEGARLTPEAMDTLATNGHWYARGPESLVAAARAALDLGSEILTDALADLPEQRRTELAENLHTVSRRLASNEHA